jgi:hypothetical protein
MIDKLLIHKRYGVIPNSILNDKSLSLRAKGLFAYLNSKPSNWQFRLDRVESSDGIHAIRSALNELIERGYIERRRIYDERHRFRGFLYILKENPNEKIPEEEILNSINTPPVEDEESAPDYPKVEIPTSENRMSEVKTSKNSEIEKPKCDFPTSENRMSEDPKSEFPKSEFPTSENPKSENRRMEIEAKPLEDKGEPNRYKNRINKTELNKTEDFKSENIEKEKEKENEKKEKKKEEKEKLIDLQALKEELALSHLHIAVNKRVGEMIHLGEFYEAIPKEVFPILKELGLNRSLRTYDREQLFKLKELAGGWDNLINYLKKCIELRPRFGFLMGFDWQTLIKKYDFIISYEPAPILDYSKFPTPKSWYKYAVENIPERWIRKLTFDWYFHWKFSDFSLSDVEKLVEKIIEGKKSVPAK